MKLKNRLTGKKKLRDVMINFSYNDEMLAELQVQFKTEPALFYFDNHVVYEVERVCESKSVEKLVDVLNNIQLHSINKGNIVMRKTDPKDKKQQKEQEKPKPDNMFFAE